MAAYNGNPVPLDGQTITYVDGGFVIPDRPVIPYIEGDGTGRDIWKASQRVFDAAVKKVFGGKKQIHLSAFIRKNANRAAELVTVFADSAVSQRNCIEHAKDRCARAEAALEGAATLLHRGPACRNGLAREF